MARKTTSTLDELVERISRLPWWVSGLIGFVSWLSLSRVATEPLPALASAESGGLSAMMFSQLLYAFAMIGQYLIPLICLIGVVASLKGRIRGSEEKGAASRRRRAPRAHKVLGAAEAEDDDERAPRTTVATPPRSPAAFSRSPAISCPLCGAQMVRRVATQGRNSGEIYWGCSKYPGCQGVVKGPE